MTKSKIMIILLALVLSISVIGGCFALYTVDNAPKKDITIGIGESVTLAWGNTIVDGVFTPTTGALSPATPYIFDVKLTGTNTTDNESIGRFWVDVHTVYGDSLEDYLTVSASTVTVENEQETLQPITADIRKGTEGFRCALSSLPQSVRLSFALTGITPEKYVELQANGGITVTLRWEIVETAEGWELSNTAYYLIGSFSDWQITSDRYILTKNSDTTNGKEEYYTATPIYLEAGTELKVKCGDSWYNNLKDSSLSLAEVSDGNIKILSDGYYNFYYCVNHNTESEKGLHIGKVTVE